MGYTVYPVRCPCAVLSTSMPRVPTADAPRPFRTISMTTTPTQMTGERHADIHTVSLKKASRQPSPLAPSLVVVPDSHLPSRLGAGRGQHSVGPQGGVSLQLPSPRQGPKRRTNLYYIETTDGGASWQSIDGIPVKTPVTSPENPDRVALVVDQLDYRDLQLTIELPPRHELLLGHY